MCNSHHDGEQLSCSEQNLQKMAVTLSESESRLLPGRFSHTTNYNDAPRISPEALGDYFKLQASKQIHAPIYFGAQQVHHALQKFQKSGGENTLNTH